MIAIRPGRRAAHRDQPARRAPGAHLLATLEHARDTGRTIISNQTTLPGDLDLPTRQRPVAFELFVPVYGSELGQNASVAERVGPGSLVASEPEGFRAGGPDVRETRFTSGERTFVLRYAPLAGNPILTERTIPASLLLGAGVGVSVLLGARTDKGTCSIGVATWARWSSWSPGPTGPVRGQGGRSQPELRRPRRGRRAGGASPGLIPGP